MAKKKTAPTQELLHFPKEYWLIAADLSLKRPGFCKFLVTNTDGVLTFSEFKTISVDNKTKPKTHGQLLDEILKELSEFLPNDDKELYLVREKAFNARAAQSEIGIYKVVGVTDWLAYRLGTAWNEIYPVSVKKAVTGSGTADKAQVAAALPAILGEHEYKNDDESDAAAVAAAFLIQQKQITIPEKKEET